MKTEACDFEHDYIFSLSVIPKIVWYKLSFSYKVLFWYLFIPVDTVTRNLCIKNMITIWYFGEGKMYVI